MNIKLVVVCFYSFSVFWQCKTSSSQNSLTKSPRITVIQEGFIDCFSPSWDSTKNKWSFCEASACLFLNDSILIASDKPIPLHSSVFQVKLSGYSKVDSNLNYIDIKLLQEAQKYEDFSLSPDQKQIFLTTGFDRIKKDDATWNSYNTLLTWKLGNTPQVIAPKKQKGQVASLPIREQLSNALSNDTFPKGMPYFKVEGLAALPNQKLLFGIREMGKKYDDFNYSILFLEATYRIENNGQVVIDGDFKRVYEFKPNKANYPELKLPIALSSIEYSPLTDKIYMTTSFEQEGELGAYLWELTPKMLTQQANPRLFYHKNKEPYCMKHKAEGITIINKNHVFIVHDDDRELINGRQPHQTAYTILRLN